MNPNPLSLTSRLILPLGIRVSLGWPACPKAIEYQVSFHRVAHEFHGFWPSEAAEPTGIVDANTHLYKCLARGFGAPTRAAARLSATGRELRAGRRLGRVGPSLERFGAVSSYLTVTVIT